MRIYTHIAGYLLITVACGCSHSEEGAHVESPDTHGDEIILSPEKARAAGVEVTEITPSDFHGVVRTGGRIMPATGGESTVVSTVAGIARRSKDFVEGMPVSKGMTLFTVSTSSLPEGDIASKARIEFEKARKDKERADLLREEKLITDKEYREAEAAFDLARQVYDATGRPTREHGISITSPASGYVKQCDIRDGDFVEVGQTLMTITQDRRLYLRADVPERLYGVLGEVSSANFRPAYSDRVFSLSQLDGRKISAGRGSADTSAFVPVTFEFTNAAGIVPGSYAEIYLITDPRTNVLSVPLAAITEEQGVKYVYVQVDEEGYEKREVTTGEDDGERIEIKEGLHAGERVVTSGAVHVKLASASAAIPEHNHNH